MVARQQNERAPAANPGRRDMFETTDRAI